MEPRLTRIRPGDIVSWDHMPRDAWGCTVPIAAAVTRVGLERVRIEVIRDDGKIVAKWVKSSTLFPWVDERTCESEDIDE